jgi:hypothetical protein
MSEVLWKIEFISTLTVSLLKRSIWLGIVVLKHMLQQLCMELQVRPEKS